MYVRIARFEGGERNWDEFAASVGETLRSGGQGTPLETASDAIARGTPQYRPITSRQRSAGDGSRCCAAHRCPFRSRVPRPPNRCSGLSGALPAW